MAEFYYNTRTREVEEGRVSSAFERMGPYASEAEAREALEKAKARSEAWEKADEEWKTDWEGEDEDDWDESGR